VIGGDSGGHNLQHAQFVGLYGGQASGTEADVQQPIPLGGTISNFYFHVEGTSASSQSTTITLRVNGTATTITCTLAAGGTGCSDTTHTAVVTAGQSITITNGGTGAMQDIGKGVSWSAQYG
jgi:hypothetical protein